MRHQDGVRTRVGPGSSFKLGQPALGDIKAAITGTCRSIKACPALSGEFEYRFNRRYDLAVIVPRLCWACVRTPPMPYRLLKLAEVYA
jgi:hypothetical protein